MELQKLMIDYLSKTLGKSDEEITALLFKKADDGQLTDELNAEALTALEDLHAEHVKATPADTLKAEYDRGHQQGKFEALSKEEEAVRKKYGIESKAKLSALIDEAISKTAKIEGADDKVLIHPLYLKLKTESETAIESVKSEYETKLTEVTTKAERQGRFAKNLTRIEAVMQEAGVILPKNPAAAAKIKDAFLREFEGFDFDEQETGVYLKGPDGVLQKDKHGHPITLDAFTKAKSVEWFDIELQPGRKSPGSDPGTPPKPIVVPTTTAEFETAFYAETDPVKKADLAKAFEAANRN